MKREIKLHNRRVAVQVLNEESIMLEFKSLDKDTYDRFHEIFWNFGVILDSEKCVRTVKVKLSHEALFAIEQIAKDIRDNEHSD